MANNYDQFPLYDPIIKEKTELLSEIWKDFLATFFDNLNSYMSQFGFFIPNLTTTQRDSIQAPQKGQLIYNTTLNSAQYYNGVSWISF